MSFQYRTRDPIGNVLDNESEFAGAGDARQQSPHDGFPVATLQETDGGEGIELLAPRVSRKDIIYLTSQLAIMVETGITLAAALEGIIGQEKNPTMRKLLLEVRDGVLAGDEFSATLEKHPKYFDKTYIALIRASEATGTLGAMLERIAKYLGRELEARGKVRSAMMYPTVMLVMAMGVTLFLLTFVLPKFAPLFSRKGTKLPKPTVFMMGISDMLMDYWYLWLAGVIALVLGFILGKRTDPGRQAWDWVKINTPILGPMFRKVAISRSVRTLGTMVASGVSVLESLRLSAEVCGNYHYEVLWNHVLDRVTAGCEINEALSGSSLFPSTLVQMISAGEQTGKLDVVLEKVSSHYDGEVDAALKTATSLIEPIMICVMGFVVGGIALSLLLPIFTLSKSPG